MQVRPSSSVRIYCGLFKEETLICPVSVSSIFISKSLPSFYHVNACLHCKIAFLGSILLFLALTYAAKGI